MLDPHLLPDRLDADGFVVRSWMPGDGPGLLAALLPSHAHLKRWMPWSDPDPDPDEVAQRVRMFRGDWLLSTNFVAAVWDPTETMVLGGTGFHLRGRPLERAEAEIGMWIAAPAANRGLGTAVLLEMLSWGFDTWGFERLEWHCDAENHASRRVAEKAGMRLEGTRLGTWRERGRCTTLAFAITPTAWRRRAG
jgi:ribosomal-protein-serine acetyltransferase